MVKSNQIDVYLEIGPKRTFAGALEWPGWCRSGRDEESALQALLGYGSRYARTLGRSRLGFKAPTTESAFVVVERLNGNATTDFGAPGIAPSTDASPVNSAELAHFEKILKACLQTFDANIKTVSGKSLRSGPRGGGRQLKSVMEHVLGSNEGYLNQVGWKLQKDNMNDLNQQWAQSQQSLLQALRASAHGEIPAKGSRGGIRWTARYFVRRVAWHLLDHAWEIEDRMIAE